MFWCTKSVKFHFRLGTKPRDQKQDTGNDCDVISGLQDSRKTDFSVIFLLWVNQFTKKWHNSALLIRKCWRNLFFAKLEVLKWRHNRPSLLLLISWLCTPPEVKFDAFGTSKHGEGKSLSNFFCYIVIRTLEIFNRANKKKSAMYTLTALPISLKTLA